MRIVVISRIFTPEPAAASFLLRAVSEAFRDAGHEVEVVTTTVPAEMTGPDPAGVRVRRAWVRRDGRGYVRGYLSYLSFDIPAFFRLLLSRRADLYLVEPPPTTGAVVRVVAWLRRTPYVYDAADLWSDAAAMATSNRFVLRALRAVERFALRGAAHAFAISDGLIERMREIGIGTPATAVGFGVDVSSFSFEPAARAEAPLFVYGGSYSEWHGAGIFVDAFERLRLEHPSARLVFVGNGSERPMLEARCRERGLEGVEFRDPVPGPVLSELLASATASCASLKPGQGYDYAFTTKVYSSLAAGCPVVFAGAGPTGPFLREAAASHAAGIATGYDLDEVVAAMRELVVKPPTQTQRAQLSEWARERFSLQAIARRIVRESEGVVAGRSPRGRGSPSA